MTTIEEPGFQAEDYRIGTGEFHDPGTARIPDGVVELRVHGVAGGTPSQNLGDPHPVQINGDDQAGVYRRRDDISIGPKRTVEAYNWSSINSGKTARAFWILLFPFAAANFAGWLLPAGMRDPRVDGDDPDDRRSQSDRVVDGLVNPWRNRLWAQTAVRFIAVMITIVVILGVAVVSMDIVGLQCGVRGACADPWWFSWFDSLREWRFLAGQPARFLILGALVPLAVLGLLWLLAKRSASYDRYGTTPSSDVDEDREPQGEYIDTVRLDTLDFWQAPDTVYIQGWIHTAAALTMLAMMLAASLIQVDQGSPVRWVYVAAVVSAGVWLAVIAALVVMVARMRQIPRGFLRREDRSALVPRRTWIPAGVPMVILAVTAIVGWNEGGSLPAGTFVLEPLRNALIWTTVVGFAVLIVLGLLVGAWRALLIVMATGTFWYLVLASEQGVLGRLGQEPFLIDLGEAWMWLVAEAFLAGLFTLVVGATAYDQIRPANGHGTDPNRRHGLLYVVGSSAVLVGLAMGADARAEGGTWWVITLLSALVVLAYLAAAFSIRADAGRTDRRIDAPEPGTMRSGTSFVLAALALTSALAIMASIVIFVARALGEGVAHSGPVQVFPGQVAYAAEAGWFALATVVGLVVLVGMMVLRLIALRLFRWTGAVAEGICDQYDDDPPPAGTDDPPPCPPLEGEDADGRSHGGWRLKLARRSRTLRLWANVIDEIDWVTTAAVMATLAVIFASIIARTRQNLPGGRVVGAVSGATWILALLAVALFLLIRSARDDRQLRATVGILWEVMGFFPRRFHPLAPPCYSERTVIELRNRLIEYEQHEPGRGKILLAHSQGTMLTTAALLTLAGPDPTLPPPAQRERTGRELSQLAFVTYGCMLERLFRRAWPDELLRGDVVALKQTIEGDDVTIPSEDEDAIEPFPMPNDDVRWMNFGRYTDYLGGRVFAPLQPKPTPVAPGRNPDGDARRDDIMFQDPTRRWRFLGETTGPRTWLHSFNYESDAEDPRFRAHVWGWATSFGAPDGPQPRGTGQAGADDAGAGGSDRRHDEPAPPEGE